MSSKGWSAACTWVQARASAQKSPAKPLSLRVGVKSGDFCALALACTPVQAALHPFELIPIALQRGCVETLNRFFSGAGVLEVVENDVGGTYRAVYTVKFAEAVFVLHCFQKKSKRGIATPKEDMDIINARLKIAEAYIKDLRK